MQINSINSLCARSGVDPSLSSQLMASTVQEQGIRCCPQALVRARISHHPYVIMNDSAEKHHALHSLLPANTAISFPVFIFPLCHTLAHIPSSPRTIPTPHVAQMLTLCLIARVRTSHAHILITRAQAEGCPELGHVHLCRQLSSPVPNLWVKPTRHWLRGSML